MLMTLLSLVIPLQHYTPKTSRVSFSKGLLRTNLWFELTQRALNNRALRMAAAVMGQNDERRNQNVSDDPTRPTAQASLCNSLCNRTKSTCVCPQYRAQDGLVGGLRERAQKVLELVMAHDDAAPFAQTVDKGLFPEYYAVVKRPMDLGSVRKSMLAGKYDKISAFAADMRLTFRNSLLVNTVGSEIFKAAKTLLAMFERLLAAFVLDTGALL